MALRRLVVFVLVLAGLWGLIISSLGLVFGQPHLGQWPVWQLATLCLLLAIVLFLIGVVFQRLRVIHIVVLAMGLMFVSGIPMIAVGAEYGHNGQCMLGVMFLVIPFAYWIRCLLEANRLT